MRGICLFFQVVVVSQTGPPTFLQANSKPLLGPQPQRGCEQVCEPTCLLVGWNYGANCHKEDDARGNAFTEKLFTSICGDGGHATTQYVLLQGKRGVTNRDAVGNGHIVQIRAHYFVLCIRGQSRQSICACCAKRRILWDDLKSVVRPSRANCGSPSSTFRMER